MSTETTTDPTVQNGDDNSTIKAMREKTESALRNAKAAEDRAKAEADRAEAAEAKLKEIERAQMAEGDRLRAELEEAKTKAQEAELLREENGKFTSAFKELYENELNSIPEEHRKKVEDLSAKGTYTERLDALRKAASLLPTPPKIAGSVTNPGTPSGQPATKLDPKQVKNMDYPW